MLKSLKEVGASGAEVTGKGGPAALKSEVSSAPARGRQRRMEVSDFGPGFGIGELPGLAPLDHPHRAVGA